MVYEVHSLAKISHSISQLFFYFTQSLPSLRNDLVYSIGKRLVGMTDVEAAIHEVFQAPHIQVR